MATTKKKAKPQIVEPPLGGIIALSMIYLFLFFVNIWEVSELSNMSDAAAGFFALWVIYKVGALLFLVFIASLVVAAAIKMRPYRFLAFYAMFVIIMIPLVLPMIYYVFRPVAILPLILVFVPPAISVYRSSSNSTN